MCRNECDVVCMKTSVGLGRKRRAVVSKIGSGDLGQFSDRASYSDRLMFSCMRRRTRYESHTTLSAPLRSLVPFSSPPSIPFSFLLFFVFTPNSRLVSYFVALLSCVRVCHLEVTSTPGFVSFVNSVNELFVTFRHNLGSQLFRFSHHCGR